MAAVINCTSEEFILLHNYRELPDSVKYTVLKRITTIWTQNAAKKFPVEMPDNQDIKTSGDEILTAGEEIVIDYLRNLPQNERIELIKTAALYTTEKEQQSERVNQSAKIYYFNLIKNTISL